MADTRHPAPAPNPQAVATRLLLREERPNSSQKSAQHPTWNPTGITYRRDFEIRMNQTLHAISPSISQDWLQDKIIQPMLAQLLLRKDDVPQCLQSLFAIILHIPGCSTALSNDFREHVSAKSPDSVEEASIDLLDLSMRILQCLHPPLLSTESRFTYLEHAFRKMCPAPPDIPRRIHIAQIALLYNHSFISRQLLDQSILALLHCFCRVPASAQEVDALLVYLLEMVKPKYCATAEGMEMMEEIQLLAMQQRKLHQKEARNIKTSKTLVDEMAERLSRLGVETAQGGDQESDVRAVELPLRKTPSMYGRLRSRVQKALRGAK